MGRHYVVIGMRMSCNNILFDFLRKKCKDRITEISSLTSLLIVLLKLARPTHISEHHTGLYILLVCYKVKRNINSVISSNGVFSHIITV